MQHGKNSKLILAVAFIFATVFIFRADFCGPRAFSSPAKGSPVQIEADTISYNDKDGLIEAEGDVTITQGDSITTARRAEYNVKTGEGRIMGGVKSIMDNITMTADEVNSYNNNERILARGNVVAVKGTDRLSGPELEYRPASQYALIPASARIETQDGVLTANRLEVFLDEERAVGTGNVHIVSTVRQIDATADKAIYYGLPKENAKVILNGNAKVYDRGNLLTGENLTVGLYDKSAEAQGGRPKLIFTPQ